MLEDTDCSLVFDSMAIRKQIIWDSNSHEYKGYCNYGQEIPIQGKETLATEALVFLLVNLKGK